VLEVGHGEAEDALDLLDEAAGELIGRLNREVRVLSDEVRPQRLAQHLQALVHVPLAQVVDQTHHIAETLAW
jgi:hypothetical protein